MSNFEVPVVRVTKVEDHPNADRLSLIYFRDYAMVSAKLEDGSPRYKVGDLVVYVPEGAVVPEYLLRQGFWDEKNNKGFLAGPKGDRVKAIKLRGILSQGIMFGFDTEDFDDVGRGIFVRCENGERVFWEGDDVAEYLGITKYEPEIPASMSGEVEYLPEGVPHFDVENIKKYPHILIEGEAIVVTEKLHGTMMGIGYYPDRDELFAFSKGLGSKGMVFRNTDENKASNVYVKALFKDRLDLTIMQQMGQSPFFMFGELSGKGIQDLHYGSEPTFRLFDVFFGHPKTGRWGSWGDVTSTADSFRIPTVPVLYWGAWGEMLREHTNGKSTLADHVREGIVIKPLQTRHHPEIGRVILKDVSEAYLTRKGGTEFN